MASPEQMESIMDLNPYLTFDGRCEAALKFYESILRGKIEALMRFADMPGHAPANWSDKVMHGSLKFGDNVLMGSDAPPERYEPMKGMWVSLQVKEPPEAERVFKALAEKGKVAMEIQETSWAHRFGMLVDQFGTPWMINCHKHS
jgi:PhnB protein